jgi:hypothetical protein
VVFLSGFAQVDTGTVQGTVRDATGGVVPGAGVTLINVDMGVSFQTKTNDVGSHQFPSVRIGNYTLVAQAPGFASATREGITISIQQRYVGDFSLRPSNIAETVNVTGEAAPLLKSRKHRSARFLGRRRWSSPAPRRFGLQQYDEFWQDHGVAAGPK